MYIYKSKEERVEYLYMFCRLCSPTTIFPMTGIINDSKIQRIKSFRASTNGIDRKPSKKLNKGNLAQKVSTPYSRGWRRRFGKAVQTVFGIFHETHPLSDLFAAFQRRLLIETWCYMRYRLYGHDGPSRSVPYKGTATNRERKKRNPRTGDDGGRLPLGPTVFSFPSSTHRSSQFFSWLAGFKPRDKKRFERQPFTSSIAFFFPLFTVALIFCARGFTNAPPLCAKRADTMNERDVRFTRCVSSRFSFAGICLLSAPVCLLLLCRRTFRLAFTFDSSTFRLHFHRLRTSVPVASAVDVRAK